MAWNTPKTWTDGDTLTANDFREEFRNLLNYLKGKEGTIQYQNNIGFSSTQTVDGVDLSAHKAGTVMSQHSGMGDHTHESSGSEGGNLSANAITSDQISISRMPRDSSTKKRLTAQGAGVDPAWVDF